MEEREGENPQAIVIYQVYCSYLGMINKLINSYWGIPTNIDKRDLNSIALICFLESYFKFKFINKVKFSTYLYNNIKFRINQYVSKYKYIVSIPEYVGKAKEKYIKNKVFENSIEDLPYIKKESLGIEFNNYSELELNLLLRELTDNQRVIFLKHCIFGYTFAEIAKDKRVSIAAVSESYQSVLRRLRE